MMPAFPMSEITCVNPSLSANTAGGGMTMNSKDYWQLFLDSGAPEYYLLYQNALKMEGSHVLDDSGHRAAGHGLQ